MLLGVPTLCRSDLLDELIRSAEIGVVKPSGYLIVDNGGGYPASRAREVIGDSRAVVSRIRRGRNLGVATSWNLIIEEAAGEPVVIANDDVRLGPMTFDALKFGIESSGYLFVASLGFALFAIRRECVDRIGWFDERFHPAYFEDIDYHRRITLAGVPTCGVAEPDHHGGSSTLRALEPDERRKIDEGFLRNREYYRRKWGDYQGRERFLAPFDGKPPEGWKERVP